MSPDSYPAASIASRRARAAAVSAGDLVGPERAVLFRHGRQIDREFRAPAGRVPGVDAAAVEAGDLVAKVETNPQTVVFGREEWIEDSFTHLGGEAGALVADARHDVGFVSAFQH